MFGRSWNISKYKESNPGLEQFSADLAKFSKWANDMERIQTSSTRGILYIDSKVLKGSLTPIPVKGNLTSYSLCNNTLKERESSYSDVLSLFYSSPDIS